MKQNSSHFVLVAAIGLAFAISPTLLAQEDLAAKEPSAEALPTSEAVVAAFIEHVDNSKELSDEQKQQFHSVIDSMVDDPTMAADILTEGLGVVYPEYLAAVEASYEDDDSQSVRLLEPLTANDDLFLAADATFYLGRVLLNMENYEQALPRFESLSKKFAAHTVHANNAEYFKGVALAAVLKNRDAIKAFEQFLMNSDNAPERMRISALRQISNLQSIREGGLEDAHQRMVYTEDRLRNLDAGESTREQQKEIDKILAKMIEEQEKQEASQSSQQQQKNSEKKQCDKPGEQQQPGSGQQKGGSKSKSPGESSRPNGTAIRRQFDNGPPSPWDRLRDLSRDTTNTAIKERLPARYRDIIDRYGERVRNDE